MNWYSLCKLSQIWVDRGRGDFEDNLKAIYGFEYKYAMVNAKLNATPQRKQNILNNLQQAFMEPAQNVVGVLIKTFGNWLKSHAILDPDLWARQRTISLEEEPAGLIDNILHEYSRYARTATKSFDHTNIETQFSEFIKNAFKNINSLPVFKKFLEGILLPEQRSYLLERLESEGLKEFNAFSWKKFRTKQQAEKYIENLTLGSVDMDDLFFTFMPDEKSFAKTISTSGLENEILFEMYKVMVFPLWRDHWVRRGIKTTRETVQGIYDSLNSIDYSNLGNTSATINIAINAAHQNGSMVDYIEEEVGESGIAHVMELLTKGTYKAQWGQLAPTLKG